MGWRQRSERPTPATLLEPLTQAWTDLLSRWSWDWFATLTFRGDAVHPEAADKRFRVWASKINRSLYGPRWFKRNQGIRWARALELQRRGVIHFHALVGGDGVNQLRRLAWMDKWDELAGFARIEPPRSGDAVRAYCAKYVVKGGELELGGQLATSGVLTLWAGPGAHSQGDALGSTRIRGPPLEVISSPHENKDRPVPRELPGTADGGAAEAAEPPGGHTRPRCLTGRVCPSTNSAEQEETEMAKVNLNDYGNGEQRPKLTPAVLRNIERTVLTVRESRTGIETGDGRKAAFLVFDEHPDHAYWLNRTGLSTLVERLGGDDDDWIGRRVPLVRVQTSNPTTGASVLTYHVAPLAQWDEHLLSEPDAAARP